MQKVNAYQLILISPSVVVTLPVDHYSFVHQ